MALCAGVPGECILLLSQGFQPGPLKQGAGKELETRVGDDGNEHKPRTGSDRKEKGKK